MSFICFLLGHRYKVTQELSENSRRMCCARCRRMFAMGDECKTVVEWDAEFHRMFESHGIRIRYLEWEGNIDAAMAEDKP